MYDACKPFLKKNKKERCNWESRAVPLRASNPDPV